MNALKVTRSIQKHLDKMRSLLMRVFRQVVFLLFTCKPMPITEYVLS